MSRKPEEFVIRQRQHIRALEQRNHAHRAQQTRATGGGGDRGPPAKDFVLHFSGANEGKSAPAGPVRARPINGIEGRRRRSSGGAPRRHDTVPPGRLYTSDAADDTTNV